MAPQQQCQNKDESSPLHNKLGKLFRNSGSPKVKDEIKKLSDDVQSLLNSFQKISEEVDKIKKENKQLKWQVAQLSGNVNELQAEIGPMHPCVPVYEQPYNIRPIASSSYSSSFNSLSPSSMSHPLTDSFQQQHNNSINQDDGRAHQDLIRHQEDIRQHNLNALFKQTHSTSFLNVY